MSIYKHIRLTNFLAVCFLFSSYTVPDVEKAQTDYKPKKDTFQTLIDSSGCDTVVSLQKTICYGACPDFRLALLSNGKVYYEGNYFVKKTGFAIAHFRKQELFNFIPQIKKSGFFKLKNKYECYILDHPTLTISVKINRITKRVYFESGCSEYVQEDKFLYSLANKIENISGVEEWIK